MDEILFRSSQKIENLQIQLDLAADHSKNLLHHYSQQSKSLILQAWNSPLSTQLKQNAKDSYDILLNLLQEIREKLHSYVHPRRLYYNLMNLIGNRWTKRDICFVSLGFICGTFVGIAITVSLRKRAPVLRYMQAIQCTHYLGIESATVMEDALAPHECTDNNVIVNVKAASVHVIDAEICNGYGRTVRKILGKIYKQMKSDLPVTLGRDCTGIITDIGKNVQRLEVGDEVWLTVPFWSQGTLCQTVLVSANQIGKKPKNVGFEGACSLPYAGCIALNALKEAGINSENAKSKSILINGGCTPVGCVLIQILKHWQSNITATCNKRAVPVAKALGCSDIIILTSQANDKSSLNLENTTKDFLSNILYKELELRDRFDVIITTKDCGLSVKDLRSYCNPINGIIVSTIPSKLSSDSFRLISRLMFGGYVRFIYYLEKLFGISLNDFDEAHMCYVSLDEIAELVESGHLQTVVEKVFHPQDIEIALNHIQSSEAIGSTVITFR